jgi:tetratricopeptide (TPR) repeat protein
MKFPSLTLSLSPTATMRLLLLPLLAASSIAAQAPDRLFQERRFDEARAVYKAQLASNKNDANAMFWMGRIANAENKTGEAIEWFEKAVKRDDSNALYHYHLGGAVGDEAQKANKLRQPFLARRVKAEFERAVALDPKMIDARQGLVDFYSMAPGFMGGSMDKAREQVAEITKLNTLRGHVSGGRLAERDKDYAVAEREYQAAIATAPDSTQAYYALAALYRAQSKWDDSFAVYERIMQVKPDELVAHLGWGAVSAASGKSYERGERELRYFLANATLQSVGYRNLAGAHFRLGQIQEKTARRDQAKAEYAEALKINPQHSDAKKALEALK